MYVEIYDSIERVNREAADIVRNAILEKPDLVLGLVAGNTPIRMYEYLARMHQQEALDFSKVTTFNLNEYVGLPASHHNSFHHYMHQHFLDHISIDPKNVYIPNGLAMDVDAFCKWYEERVEERGGIDLQILGLGRDGHISFNEPGSSLGSRTRVKALTPETISDMVPLFDDQDEIPRFAITMGVGNIMEAKRVVLLACGKNKAKMVAAMVEGPISAKVPASALQMHPHATVLLDEGSASELENLEYYRWVAEHRGNKNKLLGID